jgi:ERCC4-related helicase
MGTAEKTAFPLFDKAKKAAVLETGNALIVAPTATGKSYIGRAILRGAVQRKEGGVNVYLVPSPTFETRSERGAKILKAAFRRPFLCASAARPNSRPQPTLWQGLQASPGALDVASR